MKQLYVVTVSTHEMPVTVSAESPDEAIGLALALTGASMVEKVEEWSA